jgi:hypothetical protein
MLEAGRIVRHVVQLAFGAALFVNCSSTADEGEARRWRCDETSGCSCYASDAEDIPMLGFHSPHCSFSYGCCLLNEREMASSLATCECFDTDAACDAEAQSRPGTTVVPSCPPAGEFELAACAALGENCRWSYLQSNELAGCCAGTLCRLNAEQVPVCEAGTDEEIARWDECQRGGREPANRKLELLTPTLATNRGDISFDEVRFSSAKHGPNGCLNGFEVTLEGASGACELRLGAEMVEGRLQTVSLAGSLRGCPGFEADASAGLPGYVASGAPSDFTFEGLACNAYLVIESYCVAGTFDFRLDGEYGNVEFDDQYVSLRGVICGSGPDGECPAL